MSLQLCYLRLQLHPPRHFMLTLYAPSLLQLNSIVRRTMKEADEDKDNFIDFEEFKKVRTSC